MKNPAVASAALAVLVGLGARARDAAQGQPYRQTYRRGHHDRSLCSAGRLCQTEWSLRHRTSVATYAPGDTAACAETAH